MSYSRVDAYGPTSPGYPPNQLSSSQQANSQTSSSSYRGENTALMASSRNYAQQGGGEAASPIGGSEFGPYSHLHKNPNDPRSGGAAATSSASSHSSNQKYNNNNNTPNNLLLDSKEVEPDDYLHNPDPNWDKSSHALSLRGFLNVLTLILIGLALVMLFAGYPILANTLKYFDHSTKGGFNLGGTNGSGQVPDLKIRQLVDSYTPVTAQSVTIDNEQYQVVFSDEFEEEGRTFWPGDDPYWEAVDMYYFATHDYEWYSPEAVNTTGGALLITMEAKPTHNLNFRSGMVQSWNKFCFQGGYIEFSIKQPGTPTQQGYWPAAWLMGNLGRPGYLASTHGMWPYSYQSCDTGILDGQLFKNRSGPTQVTNSDAQYAINGRLSFLPGMRVPSCTCKGQSHPGPPGKGRSSPEIDILEAQIQNRNGGRHSFASQSLQTAPFDINYQWDQSASSATIYGAQTRFNEYTGSPLQEAVSGLTQIPDRGFFGTSNEYVTYGLVYSPDWDGDGNGSITWFVDGQKTWTVHGSAMGPVPQIDIGQRVIPTEPMSIIMNLGIASGFQPIDFSDNGVQFPAYMAIDYVRVYQKPGQIRIGCDPVDHPTAKYIQDHLDLYMNPNLTMYTDKYDWPTNRLANGTC